jgi:hypothetical protein
MAAGERRVGAGKREFFRDVPCVGRSENAGGAEFLEYFELLETIRLVLGGTQVHV